MALVEKFALIALVFCLGAQVFRRSFLLHNLKLFWFLGCFSVFGTSFYWSFLQYYTWRHNELGKFFLPPYQPISYFFSYVFWRFFAPSIITFFAALAAGRIAKFVNRSFGERFFEKEEYSLMGLGILFAGYPTFLLYLSLIAVFALFLSAFYYFLRGGSRAPLFYLWLPTAILAIIIKIYFIPSQLLGFFAF